MTLNEYQELAMRTAGPAVGQGEALQLSALGLCGESSEFADLIKKHVYHGHLIPRQRLIDELGDILWYVARACQALDIPLNDVAKIYIAKLRARYPEGFPRARSIQREEAAP